MPVGLGWPGASHQRVVGVAAGLYNFLFSESEPRRATKEQTNPSSIATEQTRRLFLTYPTPDIHITKHLNVSRAFLCWPPPGLPPPGAAIPAFFSIRHEGIRLRRLLRRTFLSLVHSGRRTDGLAWLHPNATRRSAGLFVRKG